MRPGEAGVKALVAALSLAGLSSASFAQASGAYKLIIAWYQTGIVAIDYPSRERCEQARRAVESEIERRASQNVAAGGTSRIGISAHAAFCIPA